AVEGAADVPGGQELLAGHVPAPHQARAGRDVQDVATRIEDQVAPVGDRDQRAGRDAVLERLDGQAPATSPPSGGGGAAGQGAQPAGQHRCNSSGKAVKDTSSPTSAGGPG